MSRHQRQLIAILCSLVVLPLSVVGQYCQGGQYRTYIMSGTTAVAVCNPCLAGYSCPGDNSRYQCPNGTFSMTSQTNCSLCSPGTFASDVGSSACTQCPPGTANGNTGSINSTDCVSCTPGTYNPNYGAPNCIMTGPGTFTNVTRSKYFSLCAVGMFASGYINTACSPCAAGTTTTQAGMSTCQSTMSCPAGTYMLAATCAMCPAGQYSNTKNAAACTLCQQGTYAETVGSNTSSACLRCPAGTYGETEGSPSSAGCTPCPPGSYNPTPGATSGSSCRQCKPGTFSNVIGASSDVQCTPCLAGSYSSFGGATSCDVCGPGTYGTVSGATSFASCSSCRAGSFSSSLGANSSKTCISCPAGMYSPSSGSVTCTPCEPGFFASANGSAACLPCQMGSYNSDYGANASSMCQLCPAGTYGLSPGATSPALCIACSPGQYSRTLGATSFTTCRLCRPGSFANSSGTSTCAACPIGTASSLAGSSSPDDCLPCDPGYFADVAGQSLCEPCAPGSFQNESGGASCSLCPPGSAVSSSAATRCRSCDAGFFASVSGLAVCFPCPSGTLQLGRGGTECSGCPDSFTSLPAGVSTPLLETDVCTGLSHAVVLNWGPVENPVLLASNVTVALPLPVWLFARVTGGSIIMLSSDMIPASAAANGSLALRLTVTHTCRADSWNTSVALQFNRVNPAFISNQPTGSVQACPDFSVTYTAMLGTCSTQTVVIVTLVDGSQVPPFVSWTYENGLVQIVGTVPSGTLPFSFVAVAQLGRETFKSASTTVSLVSDMSLQILTPLTAVRACPYINVAFTAARTSSCGSMRLSATLSDGSPLPSFLAFATTTNSDNSVSGSVFGSVPANYASFSIIVSASGGGVSAARVNSSAVTVSRPDQVMTPVNVSLLVLGGDSNYSSNAAGASSSSSSARYITSSVKSMGVALIALYGVPLHVTARISQNVGEVCTSLGLRVSLSPPTTGTGAAAQGDTAFPIWISVTSMTETAIVVSAAPTADVLPGTSTTVYIWANDGLWNPGFNITIEVQSSLRVGDQQLGQLPTISTPAALVEMQLKMQGIDTTLSTAPILICPETTTAAFCSFSPESNSLGAFGTPAGVNAVLQGLRVALAISTNDSGAVVALMFKESINPNPLLISAPLAALRRYSGVSRTSRSLMNLTATVGKSISEPIDVYFTTEGSTPATFTLLSDASWLVLQSGYIVGTPLSVQSVRFTIFAADKYTSIMVNGSVNSSWPLSPVAKPPPINHWRFVSSSQVDLQLPSDLISDPQNGTIKFDLRQQSGEDLTAPPTFLNFDGNGLRLSGSPAASDVGDYELVLIGTSQYGPWTGNSTIHLFITVQQSWADFFAWVYGIVGYSGSAFAVVTGCMVYRAYLTNMIMFRRRFRDSPPESLCSTGRYVISNQATQQPISADTIKAVHVTPIRPSDSGRSGSRCHASAYSAIQSKLSESNGKLNSFVGVPWVQAVPQRDARIEIVIDFPTVDCLIATGRALREDEFYLEIISNGLWSSGTVIEAFTFRLSELVDRRIGSDAGDVGKKDESESFATVSGLSKQLKALRSRLLDAETKATDASKRAAESVVIANEATKCAMEANARAIQVSQDTGNVSAYNSDRQAGGNGGPPLVDPYTGGAYLRSDNSHRTVVDVNDEIDMLMMSRYPLAVPAVEL